MCSVADMSEISRLLFFVSLCLNTPEAAKILGVFPVTSISHQVIFQSIWRELSLRGHEVTIITPNPLNDKTLINLTEIDVGFTYEIFKRIRLQESIKKDVSPTEVVEVLFGIKHDVIEAQLQFPEVQSLIGDKSKHFDLVLVEFLFPAVYAFSGRFRCPLIGITSLEVFLGGFDAVGNPPHPLLHSDFFLSGSSKLTLFDRIFYTWFAIWYRYKYYYEILPKHDKLAKKYIGNDLPYLGDIERNVSMLFINRNLIFNVVKANVPAIIELNNMHMKTKPLALPKNLQEELDNTTEGVIYFSLGTNVQSAQLSEELRKELIETFADLPYKIIWKFENEHLPGKTDNVVIRPWLPQQDILRHPNVKVFVTQGGQQSVEEAIYNGVPLVGIPFFGEQLSNIEKVVSLGMGKIVDPEHLTKEILKSAIIEVAESSKYRQKAKELSDLSRDMPMTGLEKAIWWTEYVLRHKGAHHLRSPALDIPLYQYLLLDVIGLALITIFIAIFLSYKLFLLSIKLVTKLHKSPKQKKP